MPPAELDTAELPQSSGFPNRQKYQTQLSPTEATIVACDAELECRPTQQSLTRDQLDHLGQAIFHLQSAGMTDDATVLLVRHERAVKQLRDHQQRELIKKSAELKRLAEEVEQLKAELQSSLLPRRSLEFDFATSVAPTPGTVEIEVMPEVDWMGITPLSNQIHLLLEPIPPAPRPLTLPDPWRRVDSLFQTPQSATPDSEYAAPFPIPPAPAPFHLIPSPQTSGRPLLLFPMAPMRSAKKFSQREP